MSNSTKRNGSHPTTALRIKNSASNICRNFIWGICFKGAQCKHRHVRDFESMKETLKFCHDYQNKTGCVRPDCTYLHVTRDEHKLFLTTGRIPRVLTDRYAAISNPVNTESEGMTHQNMPLYMGKFLHQPPPPLPVPMVPQVTVAMQPHMARPPLLRLPSLLVPTPPLPPPPPPPPLPPLSPPPPTKATTSLKLTCPKYTSTSQTTPLVMCPLNQPPLPLPPNFDASKPPPPLPPHLNRAQKRFAESWKDFSCIAKKYKNYNTKKNIKLYYTRNPWKIMKMVDCY